MSRWLFILLKKVREESVTSEPERHLPEWSKNSDARKAV
jgi:hypothetical protein